MRKLSNFWLQLCANRFVVLCLLLVSSLYTAVEASELQERLKATEKLEQELAAEYQKLSENGLTVNKLLEKLQAAIEALPAEQRAKIKELDGRKAAKLPADSPLVPLLNEIRTHDKAYQDFQTRYEQYAEAKLEYLLARYHLYAKEVHDEVMASKKVGTKRKKQVEDGFKSLNKLLESYYASKGELGGPKDRARGQNARRYLWRLLDFSRNAGKGHRTFTENFRLGLEGIKSYFAARNRVGTALAVGPSLPELGRSFYSGKNVLRSLNPIWDRIRQLEGIARFRVEGKENLTRNTEGKPIQIIAPMHSNSFFDNAAVAKIIPPKTAVMSAFGPEWLLQLQDKSPDFVVVKHTQRNPIIPINERVNNHGVRGIVVYPEGGMPSFMYETRRPHDNFATLVALLKRDGYDPQVVPVSLPDNFRLLQTQGGQPNALDSNYIDVLVNKPLQPEVVSLVLASGDRLALNRVIRQQWISSSTEHLDPARIAGMPTVKALGNAIDQHIAGRTECARITSLLGRVDTREGISSPQNLTQ